MECVETEIREVRVQWAIYTKVCDVKEIDGKFFVHFDGSRESLCFGSEPSFKIGDDVRISFEKVMPYAKPSKPPVE